MKSWPEFPFHSILFALYPVAALASVNISEIDLAVTYRPFLLAAAFGLSSFIFAWALTRDKHRAGILASTLVLLFFAYGHVYAILKTWEVDEFVIGRHRYLLPVGAIIGLASWWITRNRPIASRSMTRALNGIALVALIISAAGSGRLFLVDLRETPSSGPEQRSAGADDQPAGSVFSPDVYYIVLDGYARQDTLENWFDYDNSPFLGQLAERGFFVADQSNSNFFGTAASLTSVLNMRFIQDLGIDLAAGIYPGILREPLQNSAVVSEFRSMGYIIVAFPTDYPESDLINADYYLTPDTTRFDYFKESTRITSFEALLIRSTALRAILDLDSRRAVPYIEFLANRLDEPRQYRRVLVESTLDHLAKVPSLPSPKFVFAHIVSPHAPYIFHSDGALVSEAELSNLTGNPLSDHTYYLGQLEYISGRVLEVIDALQEGSDEPPIIVLQADHGPDLDMNWDDPSPAKLRARMAILNAISLPDRCRSQLSSTITSVNTFRVVFGCIDANERRLLPDSSFYSNLRSSGRRLELVPVEDLLH